MADYFNKFGAVGYFGGAVMLQDQMNIGGTRSVFVDLLGNGKNELTFPTSGGQLQNPFKTAPAKFWAGDLFELRYDDKGEDPKLYLLKMFEVKSLSGTTLVLYRDEFRHVPCVGDIIMKAPEDFSTSGKAHTITKVEEGDGVWNVTLNTTIDACSDHDILIEGAADGESQKPLLHTINGVAPSDGDFVFMPTTDISTKTKDARMFYTPAMHGIMYIHKMTNGKLPKCVMDLNKSRFNGWYEV